MLKAYRYCGLQLASTLPLPELQPWAGPAAAPDLHIRLAPVPAALAGARERTALYAHDGQRALWALQGIGRFAIEAGGHEIRVQPAPGAAPGALRLMLLHPVMALASVMRGQWMLQAAAVARNGRAYAFIGPPAGGKSSAAALLCQRGFRLLSDGLLRISRAPDGTLLAHPQTDQALLWPDCLAVLRRLQDPDGERLPPAQPVREGIALRRLRLPAAEGPVPLARIAWLRAQRGDDLDAFQSQPRLGARAFETVLHHTAGNTWLDALADRRKLFQWAVSVARQARLEALQLPWGWQQADRLASELELWCDAGALQRRDTA